MPRTLISGAAIETSREPGRKTLASPGYPEANSWRIQRHHVDGEGSHAFELLGLAGPS